MAYRKKNSSKKPKRDWNLIDERSGFKIKASQATINFDGVITHKDDADIPDADYYKPYRPQQDKIMHPISQEETDPNFID